METPLVSLACCGGNGNGVCRPDGARSTLLPGGAAERGRADILARTLAGTSSDRLP